MQNLVLGGKGLANDDDLQNHHDHYCKYDDDYHDDHEVRMQNLVLGGTGLANDDDHNHDYAQCCNYDDDHHHHH